HLRGAGRRVRELERAAVPGRPVDGAPELHLLPVRGWLTRTPAMRICTHFPTGRSAGLRSARSCRGTAIDVLAIARRPSPLIKVFCACNRGRTGERSKL